MIATLLRISRITLRRDRVAQAMTFLLPIVPRHSELASTARDRT